MRAGGRHPRAAGRSRWGAIVLFVVSALVVGSLFAARVHLRRERLAQLRAEAEPLRSELARLEYVLMRWQELKTHLAEQKRRIAIIQELKPGHSAAWRLPIDATVAVWEAESCQLNTLTSEGGRLDLVASGPRDVLARDLQALESVDVVAVAHEIEGGHVTLRLAARDSTDRAASP